MKNGISLIYILLIKRQKKGLTKLQNGTLSGFFIKKYVILFDARLLN